MGSRITPIIPKERVQQVLWKTDPDTYDDRLCQLGKEEHDTFIVINPEYDEWVLEYINSDLESNKCIIWTVGKLWIAKKFHKSWNRSCGWKTIDCSLSAPIEVWNIDLPQIFNQEKYEVLPEDVFLEHMWYLDPKYYNKDKIWVKKTKYFPHTLRVKEMGTMSPNIAQELAVVFISYDEPNADANWEKVLKKAPYAKRVHGITGIFEAHKAAAEMSDTSMLYIVDGDAELLDDFDFRFVPDIFNLDVVHVWHSRNPINDLEYGYGGVKLFPKKLLLEAEAWGVDMTTSLGNKLKVIEKVSNLTAFNTSPYNAWRSAFRECVKLSAGTFEYFNKFESKRRLEAWTTKGEDKPYGKYAIAGAKAGMEFGLKNREDSTELKKINNREWLLDQFNQTKFD